MLTVHPPEAFARHHLEVDALVAVLGVYQVGELDCVELGDAKVSGSALK